jgi:hypothetical protein
MIKNNKLVRILAIDMNVKYNLENLQFVKKTLKEGTPEKKRFLWNEIRKICPPESIESKYKCDACLVNNQLLDYAWLKSKKTNWTADFTCWKCNTFQIIEYTNYPELVFSQKNSNLNKYD